MPTSRPNTIPTVLNIIRQLEPQSILDVGIGFGKWGHLFREYTDIVASENDPNRYQRANWKLRIDGIEGFPDYLTPMHDFLYNNIYVGEASEKLSALDEYDVIFMGDIIEHFSKSDGLKLLELARSRARKAVIVSTPKYETNQPELCGNELERHRSLWTVSDFKVLEGATVVTIDRTTLLAIMVKKGIPPLDCRPPMSGLPRNAFRSLIRRAVVAIVGEDRWRKLRMR